MGSFHLHIMVLAGPQGLWIGNRLRRTPVPWHPHSCATDNFPFQLQKKCIQMTLRVHLHQ